MTTTFTDSYFDLALLNRDDLGHERAIAAAESRRGRFVTTAWILVEVADALCRPALRPVFLALLRVSARIR
jgi:hypothetical protein